MSADLSEEKVPSRKYRVIALSLGQITARVIGLASAMVMARVLLKEDLAAYRQTLLAYAFALPLLQLGVSQGIHYFLPSEKVRIRGRVVDSITLLGFMGLLFALFLAFGGNQLLAVRFSNPKVAELLLWMIPHALITIPSSHLESVLVARNRVTQAAVFGVTRQLFIGIATVLPVLIWRTSEAPLIGNVVASMLFGLEAIFLMIRATPKGPSKPSYRSIKEMTSFCFPLGMAGMIGTLGLLIDKMIVASMCSPAEFTVYALGAIEIPVLGAITGAITTIMIADMRKAVTAGNVGEALRLFHLTAEKASCVIFPVMLFFLVSAEAFIITLYSDAYAGSVLPFQLYLLRLPVRVAVFGSLLVCLGKSKLILSQSITALVLKVVLCLALIPYLGANGAAYAGVINVYLCLLPMYVWFCAKSLNMTIKDVLPFKVLGKYFLQLMPITIVTFILNQYTTGLPQFVRLVLSGALFFSFVAYWANNKIYSASSMLDKLNKAIRKG